MTTGRAGRRAFDLDSAAGRVLLVDAGPSTGLLLLPHRRRDAWLARLRHRSLDARLANAIQQRSTGGQDIVAAVARAAVTSGPADDVVVR